MSEIEPTFRELPSEKKSEIKKLVGEFIVSSINDYLDRSASPVSKGKFKAFKADGDASQLFKTGDMRSSIEFKETPQGLKIGIFDNDEAPKAFNHNTGDTLPRRQFIPDVEETFKAPILNGIKKIIRENRDQE